MADALEIERRIVDVESFPIGECPGAGIALLGIHRGQESSRSISRIRQFVANTVTGHEGQHAQGGDRGATKTNA